MISSFHKDFILGDGTEVQIRQSAEDCYNFMLLSIDEKEETFTWDATETRDVLITDDLSDCERRRNEALQELWKVL